MEPVPEKKKEKNFATTTQKRRRDDASPTATTTTTTAATQSRGGGGGGGGGGQNLFKRGGAKATKYSELLEREKPDANITHERGVESENDRTVLGTVRRVSQRLVEATESVDE